MPHKSKKEHKCSRHAAAVEGGSRWHNFHFSGKVIICSVLLGFMLILVGGILLAIGNDQDDDIKPEQYDDVKKRPPMVYVGPVLMGIGGFAVIVGIVMCLFETNVCRKRTPDASPLINAEAGRIEVKDSEGSAAGYEPETVSPKQKHKGGARKKNHSKKSKASKKPYTSSEKVLVGKTNNLENTRNPLTASDKFLTPPSSFQMEVPVVPGNSGGKDQVSKAMLQSLTSSGNAWTTSGEFHTPTASFVDDPLISKHMENKEKTEPSTENHKFLSPMQSNASVLSDSSTNNEDTSSPEVDPKHEFLSPQNSNASILSDEPNSNGQQINGIETDNQTLNREVIASETAASVNFKESEDQIKSEELSSSSKELEISSEKLLNSITENTTNSEMNVTDTVQSESNKLLINESNGPGSIPEGESLGDVATIDNAEKSEFNSMNESNNLVNVDTMHPKNTAESSDLGATGESDAQESEVRPT